MNGADYIALYLERRRVTHVFELIGGMIAFLVDSLHQKGNIKIVSMHHEQGVGFAVEGFGRITGAPSVAMATSGPGATNLLTAIGSCYFDSVPAVFITGQVNRHEQKGSLSIRQLGFQETDIVSMALPVTKGAWLVNNPEDLPELLEKAFDLASSGRPGPVLLDIPMDVQRAELSDVFTPHPHGLVPNTAGQSSDASFIDGLAEAIAGAKRPLILAGGGVDSGNAAAEFRNLVQKLGIPVVHSLMGVDLLPYDHPLRGGLIGSYGNRWANTALSESDFLLVLGSRLDVRQTGANTDDFRGGKTIYHVDCERGEMNNRVKNCVVLESELKPFLSQASCLLAPTHGFSEWVKRIAELKARWPDIDELKDFKGNNPNVFMHHLSRHSSRAAAFVVDVGQHQMWAAQSLELNLGQRFLTSGGMGAMGFGLPAAIGAAFATGKPVIIIAGDGGFQLNIQELQTVVRNRLPLKIVVMNNGCHGMVRQFQDSYFKGRVQSTVWGYSAPSFKAVAEAYGIKALQLNDATQSDDAFAQLWADPESPFLLEIIIDEKLNVYPKMAFGRPIAEMEPFAKPIEMEST
jgi:acetolactate synthase-1/2/3 large subunit